MPGPFDPEVKNNIDHPDKDVDVVQPVITRAEWGARKAKSRRVLRDTTSPTLHWNGPKVGLTADSSQEEEAKYLRGVQGFHMDSREWSDIAYNFAFAPSGRVYELRGWKIRSAANGTTAGNNASHAFLLMIGEGDDVTQLMIDSVRRMRALGDSNHVKGHRDWKSTACPGAEIAQLIREDKFEGLPAGPVEAPTNPNDEPLDTPVVEVPVTADVAELREHLSHLRARVAEIIKLVETLNDYVNVLDADAVDISNHR